MSILRFLFVLCGIYSAASTYVISGENFPISETTFRNINCPTDPILGDQRLGNNFNQLDIEHRNRLQRLALDRVEQENFMKILQTFNIHKFPKNRYYIEMFESNNYKTAWDQLRPVELFPSNDNVHLKQLPLRGALKKYSKAILGACIWWINEALDSVNPDSVNG